MAISIQNIKRFQAVILFLLFRITKYRLRKMEIRKPSSSHTPHIGGRILASLGLFCFQKTVAQKYQKVKMQQRAEAKFHNHAARCGIKKQQDVFVVSYARKYGYTVAFICTSLEARWVKIAVIYFVSFNTCLSRFNVWFFIPLVRIVRVKKLPVEIFRLIANLE